jgi:hypothetical protein
MELSHRQGEKVATKDSGLAQKRTDRIVKAADKVLKKYEATTPTKKEK